VAGLAFALAAAGAGRAAVIHVPADYPTIQAAVDAAQNHDTILIAAGVYTNQVVIENKNLTLSGSPGAVLRATPGMQLHHTLTSMLEVFESAVVVSGLTFEGDRLADSQPRGFFGIFFLAANGRIEDCHFSGFRGDSFGSPIHGVGVDVENPGVFGYGAVDV